MKVLIKDETAIGKLLREIEVQFSSENITLRELISERVRAEVEAYNQKLPEYFQGLVQPSETEQSLNGFRLKNRRKIDAEKQIYIALDAFQKNGFFVLVEDKQVDDLEQKIELSDFTNISFIKLAALVGG